MTASGIFSVSIKEDGAKKHACEKRALDMQINLHWNMFFFFFSPSGKGALARPLIAIMSVVLKGAPR